MLVEHFQTIGIVLLVLDTMNVVIQVVWLYSPGFHTILSWGRRGGGGGDGGGTLW